MEIILKMSTVPISLLFSTRENKRKILKVYGKL